MHLFINELSFVGQAQDRGDANRLMADLISVVDSLNNVRGTDPIVSSQTLWQRELFNNYSVHDWINNLGKDQMRRFLWIIRKGPFVETILDKYYNYYACWMQGIDVSYSSLAGAAIFEGILASLQRIEIFNTDLISVKYQIDDNYIKDYDIINGFDPSTIDMILHQIKDIIFGDLLSWDDLWNQLGTLFPLLTFCDCVKYQLNRLDFNCNNMKIIKTHLGIMNEYLAQLSEGDVPEYSKMGILASREYPSTIRRYGDQRKFLCPDGRERIFDWHSKAIGPNIRILFYPPEDDNPHFLIGYIGPKLPTTRYPH